MKNNTILVSLVLCLCAIQQITAQTSFGKVPLTQIEETSQNLSDVGLFSSRLKPPVGTEFRLIETTTDKTGMRHPAYQQYYNGIKVHFGVLKVHEKNGLKQTYGGAYFSPKGVNLNPSISKDQVRNTAKSFIGSNDVFWIGDNEISKTVIPEPELLILPNRRTETMHLTYAIGIGTSKPELKMGIVYIDAQTGEVLKYKNMVRACFDSASGGHRNHNAKAYGMNRLAPLVAGTGATAYSGSQTIETTLDTDYILYDQTRANTGQGHNHGAGTRNGIVTVNFNNHDNINDYHDATYVSDFTDNNNNWTAAEMSANEDQYALDAHWGSQVVYDYWKNEHGRDSYDGANASIVSYVHFDTNYTNAAWVAFNSDRGFMIYGDGGGSFTPLTNLDVVGHEIGHGVNNKNVDFDYELESGALDEGFADIWAMLTDNYANTTYGTSKNIDLINDENGGGAFRSMSNPNTYGQPDTYGGTYWYNVSGCTPAGTSNDYCGVHTNSGVLNYWFWLLSQGGSGTNDNNDAYTISALGIDKAAAIALQMQSYLTATSDYADARAAGIQAAADLYGYCSTEEEVVTNAFYAVGVGNAYSSQNPVITVDTTNQTVCVDEIATFTADADYANSMIWQNDASGSWTDLSNDATYSGVTTKTLTVTNPSESLDGVRFRLRFSNDCGNTSTTNNRYLYVDTIPNVTSIVPTGAGCTSSNDGSFIVTFDDVANMSNLEFSLDGGNSFPHNYLDDTGTQTISGLAAGDYDIWVRRGNNDCPRQLGTYTIPSVPSVTATIDTAIEADLSQNDGILQVSFSDEATQSNIKFSTDGGATYPFTFDDTLGTGDLTGLGAGNYDVWVSFGDDSCQKSLGSFTINEIAYTQIPDANFENALNNLTYDNYLGDGKVPTSLVNTLTSLNVRLENITDLTGIENFTALETLIADNNNLTSVDVTNNLVLTQLVVYNNPNLVSFTIADPSIITRVTLSNCNLSGDYDFSSYTSLTNFSVQGNDLTGLNVKNGNNTNFTYFHAGGNSGLNCIVVDDPAYSTANWNNNGGATFSNFCAYTAIPDANFEAALHTLGYDDIAGDGQVPTPLISGITSLDVSNEGISDLTGINDFVALETLRLQYNNLTSLDVSNLSALRVLWAANGNIFTTIDVSNNTALEDFRLRQFRGTTVDLSNNTALTRFACTSCDILTLDTSANTNLSFLDLWDSDITSLDVRSNSNLATLDVAYTDITSLDLSSNTALTNLIANDMNSLSSLNVKNGANTSISTFNTSNTSIPCILVDDVAYSTTNWTNIDGATTFSSLYCDYTAIPDSNFEAALNTLGYDDIAGDNQVPTALIEVVTSLDVNNQVIADLTGIQDFTALTDLNVDNNGLTALDLSNNVNLQVLVADNNNITALDLTSNTALTDLDIRFNQLTTLDVSQNILLTDLNLRQNPLTSIDLSNNVNLQELNLIETGLSALDITNNTNLTHAYIRNNAFTSIDLSQNLLLEVLNLLDNDLTSIDTFTNSALRVLIIDSNDITSFDLSNNTALTRFEASNNNLSALNIKNGNNTAIPTGDFNVTGNPLLTCIAVDDPTWSTTHWTNIDGTANFSDYCEYTLIPDANFEAALDALGYDDITSDGQVPTELIEGITVLDIENEGITDLTGIQDFSALENLFAKDNSLTAIDVTQNSNLRILDIANSSVTSLDLSQNLSLTDIVVNNNALSVMDVSQNTGLNKMYATGNNIASIDLSNNPDLTHLFLNENDLSQIDLSLNTDLQFVNLTGNVLTSLDTTNNPQLQYLDLRDNSLTYLNTKSGGSVTYYLFLYTNNNSDLNCIVVDDLTHANNTYSVDVHTSFSDTYCRYTSVPDANFEARLETLGYDDISADGQVPTALIEVVTSLNVANRSITDLTGIEDFRDLESLVCSNNTFTTFDISSNSNLTSLSAFNCGLTSLDVSNNLSLSNLVIYGNSLTSLDVSANTQLVNLDLLANQLTELDLSNNTLLQILFVEQNDLSSLDLSANSALTQLTCNNNSNLSYLNVQNGNNANVTTFAANNNAGLTCIIVDDVAYSTTNWTTIDVGTTFSSTYCRYTTIPDANFEAALETLGYDDISGDGQVPTTLIETVTTLDVGSKNIANLSGIQDFSALTRLRCHNNSIQNLDLRNNTLLEFIKCDDNNMDVLNLEGLVNFEELVGYGNDFTSFDFSTLTSLRKISLFNNELTTLDLTNNPALAFIRLDNNDLTSLDVRNGYNTNITVFNTNSNVNLDCILVDDAAYSTTNWTSINPTTSFSDTYCRYTAIPDSTFESRLNALGYDDIASDGQVPTALIESVTYLYVPSNGVNDLTGIEDFLALERLICSGNNLTSIDLSTNTQLNDVDLSNNNISSIDITNSTLLEALNLRGNSLSSIDLTSNTALLNLDLTGNDITNLDVSNNVLLTDLDVGGNDMVSLDISNNVSLEYLSIEGLNITTLDISNNTLLNELYFSYTLLTTLDLSNNVVLTYLECEESNQLTDLDLSNNVALLEVLLNDNALLSNLNIKNGNNTSIVDFQTTGTPNLACILVDDAAYSSANWTDIDSTTSFSETTCTTDFSLALHVFLQGAAMNPNTGEESLMRDDLRVAGHIPTTSPYLDALTCNATVFDVTGVDAIVDWIWIELRDETDNTKVMYSRSALLQRDGDVVDVDGTSVLNFSTLNDTYYITVKHRNHLTIMSMAALTYSAGTNNIDFTSSSGTATYGANAQTTYGMPTNTLGMWAGDANTNGEIVFLNTGAESVEIKQTVLDVSAVESPFGASVFYKPQGYYDTDVNMDGEVIFLNAGNELLYIKDNILAHPSNQIFNSVFYKIQQQMP